MAMLVPQLSIALAGNPNAGKSTVFNAITGSHQHVGNYPGITVEKKQGTAHVNGHTVLFVDLPGTYSLTAYTIEEVVARHVLADEAPDAVVNVLNASALERNLYLSVQLLEMGVPVVLALNMIDEAKALGMTIDIAHLSQRMNLPVVETVARRNAGMDNLLRVSVDYALQCHGKTREPLRISYGPDIDPVLSVMEASISQHNLLQGKYLPRWIALKLLENDTDIRKLCQQDNPRLTDELEAGVQELTKHLQDTLNTYPEAVVADYRYGYITSLLRDGVLTRPNNASDRLAFSDKLDALLTHQIFGPLLLLLVLFLVYQLTFTVGAYPMEWLQIIFDVIKKGLAAVLPDGLLQSLIVSGLIDGVGGVMSFVPLIMLIFMQIAFLEDSGYMARMAYMLDRVFRAFGLHGCSVMPFIIGGGIAGGCAVPGIMAARTLRSPREKLATLLTVPFMACGAKLPVFILFVGVFFPSHEALAMFLLTLAGWVTALCVAQLLRSTVIRGAATPFVMELPPYRLPTLKGLCIHTWERTWEYLKKAGTIILAVSMVLWASMTFPRLDTEQLQYFAQKTEQARSEGEEAVLAVAGAKAQAQLRHSWSGRLGTALEPLTLYAGFNWRTDIALLGGFAAKEVIVATLGTAYSLGDPEDESRLAQRIADDPSWNKASAMALMLFVLLYAPCVVTVAAIRQETGSWGWALFSMGFNTIIAFGVAVTVYQVGRAIL
ncbi:MAG: ferrous iron transport protein B [Desulfovibrionaceae bacterium]